MKKDIFILLTLTFALVMMTGCGGGAKFSTELVEGVVTLDGEPLADAAVTFSPATGSEGTTATGKTDASGKYVLTAMQGGKDGGGTTVGKYNISVFKEAATKTYTQQEIEKASNDGVSLDMGYKLLVPQKYTSVTKSGLTAEIVKGKNTVNLELKSK